MKTEKSILIAFLLNLFFSIFELIGGAFTNSIAIISDAIHDFGDSISIGIAYLLERKSKQKPDKIYTYGYKRYSILGTIISDTILVIGSSIVIYNAITRIINPVEVNHNGMILFAVVGVIVNFFAVYFTRGGDSINQKSVNLHMLEDVLGWLVVLIGAFIIKLTNFNIIDPILSIIVAVYILLHALHTLKIVFDLFLEKIPHDIHVDDIKKHLKEIEEVIDVHHVHVWSIDGYDNYATMHIVTETKKPSELKHKIREELEEFSISHVTIELEEKNEKCSGKECVVKEHTHHGHYHHHH